MADIPGTIRSKCGCGRSNSRASLLGVQHIPGSIGYISRDGELLGLRHI